MDESSFDYLCINTKVLLLTINNFRQFLKPPVWILHTMYFQTLVDDKVEIQQDEENRRFFNAFFSGEKFSSLDYKRIVSSQCSNMYLQ